MLILAADTSLPILSAALLRDAALLGCVALEGKSSRNEKLLPSIDWLRPASVASQLTGTATTNNAAATPGLHGTGLVAVTVQPSGTALSTSGTTDIRAQKGLSFDVQVQNQGQSDEKNVTVQLVVSGAGKPIPVDQQIATIAQGATATASVALPSLPPTGRPVSISVKVKAVPGEKNLTNNQQTYQAIFTSS